MTELFEFVGYSLFVGIGATLLIDLWAVGLNRSLGVASMNWGLVGRWLGHLPEGRFIHDGIAKAAPVRGELAIGWIAHYAIGVAFAGILLAICGLGWVRQPSLLPALLFGIATVAAPFFLLQPGLGLGIAAARTPKPMIARMRSLMTHMVFGLGLYASALVLSGIISS